MAGNRGSLYLRRDCRDQAWFAEATLLVRNLWFELMLTANWKAGTTTRGVELKAGELVTSWRGLAKRLSWTGRGCRKEPDVMAVRRAMAFLERAGEVSCTGLKSYETYHSDGITRSETDQVTDHRQLVGLRVTLLRWAFHTTRPASADDEVTGQATGGSVRGATGVLEVDLHEEGKAPGSTPAGPSRFSRPERRRGRQPRDYPELHIADGQPPPTRSPR